MVVYYNVIYLTTPEEDLKNPEKSKPNYKLAYFISFLFFIAIFFLFFHIVNIYSQNSGKKQDAKYIALKNEFDRRSGKRKDRKIREYVLDLGE